MVWGYFILRFKSWELFCHLPTPSNTEPLNVRTETTSPIQISKVIVLSYVMCCYLNNFNFHYKQLGTTEE